MRGDPKKPELYSECWAPCSTGFPPLGECSKNPYVLVYQLALLWEAEFGFSEFFWRLFQYVCLFHYGWFTSTPAHIPMNVQHFLTKNSTIPIPTFPIRPVLPFYLFLLMKKSLKANILLTQKRWNKQHQKHLKGIKIDEFKNSCEQRRKCLNRYIASNGEYFEGDWSLSMSE